MATIHFRAPLSDSQLADARAGLGQLLKLHSEHEVDLTPALHDLLRTLQDALARAASASTPDEQPLGDLPLTIATRIAGEAATPEDS